MTGRNHNRRSQNAYNAPIGFSFNYSETFNRITELSCDNYKSWKTNMLYLLDINNLIDFINTEKIIKFKRNKVNFDPNLYTIDKLDNSLVYRNDIDPENIKLDNTTKWVIMNSLGNKTRKLIESRGKTAFQTWKILENSFTKSKEQQKSELKSLLKNSKYDSEIDINIFLASLDNIFEDLEYIDSTVSDETKVGILNRSLPENLRFINVFQYRDNWEQCKQYSSKVIPDIIYSNKKESVNKQIQPLTLKQETNTDLATRTLNRKISNISPKRKNGRCFLCKKFGHFAKNCNRNIRTKNINKNIGFSKFSNNKHQTKTYTNNKFQKQNRHRQSYSHRSPYRKQALNTYTNNSKYQNYKDNYLENFIQDYNTKFQIDTDCIESSQTKFNEQMDKTISIWTIDSGASVHITHNLKLLKNTKPHKEYINLANGNKIKSTHIGDFEGYVNNNKIYLHNVIYIPNFKRNLISVSKFTENNYKVNFYHKNCIPYVTLINNQGKTIVDIKANESTNTFKVWILKSIIKENNTDNLEINHTSTDNNYTRKDSYLWHRRFAHLNISNFQRKLPTINLKEKCIICAKSKLSNTPFKNSENKTKFILELIHVDLVGPIDQSIYGNKYILTILDDYSRYNWALFLQTKAETPFKLHKWLKQTMNILDTKVKFIKSDNGTEFKSNLLKQICEENGIIQLFSTPYTPQQNGRIERLNRVLIETATSLLKDAKLSKRFWEDAISTASYIYNRFPHKGINNKIPYEVLYKKPINYNNMKVFGCRVVFIIPKQFRQKFENHALPGIFLGYTNNSNAFKVFDITHNKVIISRVVEFFENLPADFYFDKQIKNTEDNYTEDLDTKLITNNKNSINNNIHNTPDSNHSSSTNENTNDNTIHNLSVDDNQNSNNNNVSYQSHNIINTNTLKSNNHNATNLHINPNDENHLNDNYMNDNESQHTNSIIIENMDHHNTNTSSKINTYNIDIQNDSEINNNSTQLNYSTTNTKRKYDTSNNISYNSNSHPCKKSKIATLNDPKETLNEFKEPTDYDDIQHLPDKEDWYNAIDEELNNMERLKVFSVIKNIPKNANIVSSKWIFKYKRNAEGNVIKRKARLVARGFTQEYGIDFYETFSPTLKQDSLRLIIALAVQYNFEIKQIDITAAYLNAPLSENIFMKPPKGHKAYNKCFLKLKKAIYGLKQSGLEWNKKLNSVLTSLNFHRLNSDPCIYKKVDHQKRISCILAVYVDDIIIAGVPNEVSKIKNQIQKHFKIKDIGNIDFIIGIKFQKYKNGFVIHQKRYIIELLKEYKQYNLYPTQNMIPNEINNQSPKKVDKTKYRSTIGKLLYLAISTRPDIIYAVGKCSRKSNNPTEQDWSNVIKILMYLKNTINYGIYFNKNNCIKAFSDADFAGDKSSRRSTSGYIIKIGSAPISWSSKLQHCVSTSTAESEYYSLCECSKQCVWLKNIMNELNQNIQSINIYVDNKATIQISKNNIINIKSKHIDIRYHFIRELIKKETIKITYIRSKENLADGLTKYLNNNALTYFRNNTLIHF